jgi:hypothetical protein
MTEPGGGNRHTPAYPIQQPTPDVPPFTLQQLAPQRPKRRTGPMVALAALAALVLLAGGALLYIGRDAIHLPGTGSTFTVSGTLYLAEGRMRGRCVGELGYNDIQGGGQVAITDASGKVLAIGELDAGESQGSGCLFHFTVPNVPAGKGIYAIEIGRRPPVRYNEVDLKDGVDLSLG